MYIVNNQDLYNSIIEFNQKPELWKSVVGSSPRYFVHMQENEIHYFGLSKFCVFKDIDVEDYIDTYRYKTDGGTARLVIQNRIKRSWTPREEVDSKIRFAFDKWIGNFFPNYRLENAKFISIEDNTDFPKKVGNITPERLKSILELQMEIGEVGEQIAYEYEIKRLKSLNYGLTDVERTSQINSAAGFDIYSKTKEETRYIEVKSTTTDNTDEFYISQNEFTTLQKLKDEAFLYLVKITDLNLGIGEVYRTIQNPIKFLDESGNLTPIAYKVCF